MAVYRHSGAVPFGGLLTMLGCGALAGMVLGVAYSWGIDYVPYMKARFLMTFFLGALVGTAVAKSNGWAKIRNSAVVICLGGVAGLVALYFAWCTKMAVMSEWEGGLPLDPISLGRFARWLYENGSWATKGNDPTTGMALLRIWLGEAGIVVGMALAATLAMLGDQPFCEACGKWTRVEKAVQRLLVGENDSERVNQAVQGDLGALADLTRAPQGVSAWLQLDLATCPSCDQTAFVTISVVQETVSKKGERETSTNALVSNLILEPQQVALVRQAGRAAAPPSPGA